MQDYIVNPTGYGDYYIAVEPRDTWECPHCKTVWEDWGEHAENEDRPWEADGERAVAEPDLGFGCPCCALQRAPWLKLARFVEESGLVRDAVNFALTEDGEGAIEQGFHDVLWHTFRLGANADFAVMVREFVDLYYYGEFVAWAAEEA